MSARDTKTTESKTAGRKDEGKAAITGPGGIRAADAASAQAYARDGIIGAPGSEIPGNDSPVSRHPAGADHPAGRPATQVEGERLSAEADASEQMAGERATREPGFVATGDGSKDS